jgi:CheY-like chemotaxis protein
MLDHDDLKWVAANLTELNLQLQQISRYSAQARHPKSDAQYLELLSEEVEQASKTSQALFDRITSRILSGAGSGKRPANQMPKLKVMPPPRASAQTRVAKKIPTGEVKIVSAPSGEPVVINASSQRELILVVDDEPNVLERAGQMLEAEDYRIVLAKDGFEALKIYHQMGKNISLIILDFFLPVMDGDAVFDELKAINPDVQVVLSSGFAEQTKLGSMLARGLCGFIPKPYTQEKLLDQVRSIIAA